MENRERDRVSQRTSPTEAGELNRRTEEEKGRETGSSVEFGKNIGRSEDLDANTEGGTMNRNRKQQDNMGSMENESSRRSGGESGYGSSSGRSSSGSSGSMNRGSSSSDVSSNRSGKQESSDSSDRSDRE
jgi:hypothetical protein